ncbi:MAG: hypothetical protein PHR60_03005 [Eubacteriales bacterium]|nr:hypothetical protein [Eubacteriales bacterium]MDD4583142.1 hypothetical protein [Eubacteriales bacterium]
MARYLSHLSAAAYWNIPYIEAVLGSEIADAKTVDFTVSKSSERFQKKGCNIHLCEIDLPLGAVVFRDHKMVASPELVFLQLASKLNIHKLILLGLQLCSHPPGKYTDAITTKKKLKAFLAKSSGHRGQSKALRAIKYIEDGSASVMESIAYMILTLPHALGGYGIRGAIFNFEINLKDEAAKRLGQQRCFMDLYYKPMKLAVEYDSFTFHNSPSEQGRDAIRSVILNRHGIDVMHLSTIQIYDRKAFTDFAANLAYRLGKRIEIRTGKFDEMNTLLRALLPSGNV